MVDRSAAAGAEGGVFDERRWARSSTAWADRNAIYKFLHDSHRKAEERLEARLVCRIFSLVQREAQDRAQPQLRAMEGVSKWNSRYQRCYSSVSDPGREMRVRRDQIAVRRSKSRANRWRDDAAGETRWKCLRSMPCVLQAA
jgi:hypothetical protein